MQKRIAFFLMGIVYLATTIGFLWFMYLASDLEAAIPVPALGLGICVTSPFLLVGIYFLGRGAGVQFNSDRWYLFCYRLGRNTAILARKGKAIMDNTNFWWAMLLVAILVVLIQCGTALWRWAEHLREW